MGEAISVSDVIVSEIVTGQVPPAAEALEDLAAQIEPKPEPVVSAPLTKKRGANWTPERDKLLSELWLSGLSGHAIGHVLGITRNAVMGRVHRIRNTLNQPRQVVTAPVRRRKPKQARIYLPKDMIEPPPPKPQVVTLQPPLNVSLFDAGPLQCRSICGQDERGIALFCGHPVDESLTTPSYCRPHAMMYFRPPSD